MKILIIEDDTGASEILQEELTAQQYLVELAPDGQFKAQDPNLNKFNPVFQDIIFQHLHAPRFLNILSQITGIQNLMADRKLYAAGLAQGKHGSFLNVHMTEIPASQSIFTFSQSSPPIARTTTTSPPLERGTMRRSTKYSIHWII
jgi:hypothetical protein